jgi:hypothetical protein
MYQAVPNSIKIMTKRVALLSYLMVNTLKLEGKL